MATEEREQMTESERWYGPKVEAVLAVFRATGDPEDPSWRSLAVRCVEAVEAVEAVA